MTDDHEKEGSDSDEHGDHHGGADDAGDGHDHHHHDIDDLAVAVVTVSSSRSMDADPSGDAIVELVEEAGHEVVARDLVRDAYDNVQSEVDTMVGREDTDTVVTTGGTGVTPDDITPEAVDPLFEKPLPGFGELFRRLSEDEIGTRSVATRATAGIADGVPVFCLPGSESAVRLGVEAVVLPEAGHLAGLASRDETDEGAGNDDEQDDTE